MSQPQPSSLPHYQALAIKDGYPFALKEASKDVDHLTDAIGRRLDLWNAVYVGCKGLTLATGVVLGLVISWLMACGTVMHTEKPSDWPNLLVSVNEVSFFELQRRCGKYMTPGQRVLSLNLAAGCAEIDFDRNRCDIWLGSGENDPSILRHEQEHCSGHDHLGDTTLRDAWRQWKERK